ncbi:MAG: hypothetical protein NZM12_10365 [Steroidobacteraceae bacterium]|nr:hypothetical protein [Steroidobacteraceae bacterium]MDW8258733.1 hypothetical protein [Gammaproteobacteria bacterium]
MNSAEEFALNVLTGAIPPGVNEVLTPSPTLQRIDSLEELRDVINELARGAQRLLSIYSPDLEPELYDQTPFLDIVKRFVLARNFAKVRVLLTERTRMLRDGNRFVAMSRRLSSYIELRLVAPPQGLRVHSYAIADDRAIVLRLRGEDWRSVADLANPTAARLQLADFDALWQANTPDYGFRIARR